MSLRKMIGELENREKNAEKGKCIHVNKGKSRGNWIHYICDQNSLASLIRKSFMKKSCQNGRWFCKTEAHATADFARAKLYIWNNGIQRTTQMK